MSNIREALRLLTANGGMELTDDAKAAARLLEAALATLQAQPAAAGVSDAAAWELWLRVCAESDNLSTRVMIANFARAVLALRQQSYALPDDLYDSKDWRQGNYASRVEWLHTMYEHAKHERDEYAAQLEALRPQAVPVGERWVVVRETSLDVGEGNDVRTGGRPELGYALISDAATFGSEDAAVAAIKSASLPVGWVVLPLSRLLPDLGNTRPAPGVPEGIVLVPSIGSGKRSRT